MNTLTLRQLRYFQALARHRHFGRAAEACSISQPALSVQIKELEETLGMPLFERGTRRVRLTGFGEEILERIQDILRSVEELGDLARASREGQMSRLRLGVIPTIAPYLLPSVLAELGHNYPGMELRVRETLTSNLLRELAEGRLDTAILALPVSEPDFAEMPLFSENFVLVRPEKDRLKPAPTPDGLLDERLLLLEEGHCFRDQALSFCNIQSALPRDGLDGSSLSTLVQMVGAGIGVTLIPEMAVTVETSAAPVAVAAFAEPQPQRTVGMIWRRSNPLADKLTEVAELVRAASERRSVSAA